MRIKLNKTNIKALEPKPQRYEVADTDTPAFRLRVSTNGIKTYILLYRNSENRQKRLTIGRYPDLTPEQAREITAKKLAEVALGSDPAETKKAARKEAERAKAATLDGFLKQYEPWLTGHRKDGAASIKRIRACFSDWMDKPLAEITPWLVDKWRKERREQGRAASTINRDLSALKSLLSTAVEWETIEQHPLTKLKPVKVDTKGKVRYLSPEEEAALRAALEAREQRKAEQRDNFNEWRKARKLATLPQRSGYADHLQPLVLLALNTGCRRGELFGLEWRDIDLDLRTLTVRGVNAKGGTTRHIPLNAEALAILTQWRKQQPGDGLLFPGKEGERLDNINTAWRKLVKDAGLVAFRFHDLRHTFASNLVMAGVDLNTVRELLGHGDIAMTLRYAHLAPGHKAAAVELLTQTGTVTAIRTG
ncbi:phage integrase [Thiohalocapsa marina]|uniref:phage integrase n=1 Tax=Thiohalocapsa marina TaxID=424902 RepID=UPI0036DD5BF5